MRHLILVVFLSFLVAAAKADDNQHATKTDYDYDGFSSPKKSMVAGAMAGAARSGAKYAVHTGGRSSNILHVVDKASNQWYARIDMPHAHLNSHHINVNPRLTGVRDPHIPISGVTAHAAGVTGRVLNAVNTVAPYAMAASVAMDAVDVLSDLKDGKPKEAARKVVSVAATNYGGYHGAGAGAVYGSMIFPGVGTLIGGIVGGIVGGLAGGVGGDVVNAVLQL